MNQTPGKILEITDLRVDYTDRDRRFRAVDGVSISMTRGSCVGLAGESGCGKSTIVKAILGLQPITSGRIVFDGRDTSKFKTSDWREYRRKVQPVFQDSLGALNPRMTVKQTLDEVFRSRSNAKKDVRSKRTAEILDTVELSDTLEERYPHELSGGQRQRVAIARALAMRPDLLIADEPVSALDVSVQAQIIKLFDKLRRGLGLSILFIAHDLAVVKVLCEKAYILNKGRVEEQGLTAKILTEPESEYTKKLLASVPRIR